MRAHSAAIALLCCVASVATAHAGRHISSHDEPQIRAAIRAVTRDPILEIVTIYENHPVPESIPEDGIEGRIEHGKVVQRPRVFYKRTDRVTVRTGSEANLKGGAYSVQRVGGAWEVVGRSYWIH
jgi:hypothetical protein